MAIVRREHCRVFQFQIGNIGNSQFSLFSFLNRSEKRHAFGSVRNRYSSFTTGLINFPIPLISSSHTSPGLRNTCGLRKKPIAAGVPVVTTSPGWRVVPIVSHSNNRGSE